MKPKFSIKILAKKLNEYEETFEYSQNLAKWAGEGYLYFLESGDKIIPEIIFLEFILGDIEAQWKCLLANEYSSKKLNPKIFCFPIDFIKTWLADIERFYKN